MTLTALDRARRIKIILFDVDGVLTNGQIWIIPVPVVSPDGAITSKMVEAKGFSAHDGAGVTLARLGGMKLGVITKRISETVAMRARDLKLEFVYQGQAFKMQAVREIMEKEGVSLEEIAYVGDDVIDLPVMRVCGLAVAVGQCAGAGEGRGALRDSAQGRRRRGARCDRVHSRSQGSAGELHRCIH